MQCIFVLKADGDVIKALEKGFLALDEQMRQDQEMKDDVSGTTAVVVVIKDKKIYCSILFLKCV